MVDRSSKVRLFIREELSQNIDIALSEDQAKYLFKVMRLNEGQSIKIFVIKMSYLFISTHGG